MPTFAHTETGEVLDPIVDADEASYRARFNADAVSRWTIVEVADGTQHGARPDGQGGWVNPTPVVIAPQPNNAGNPYFPGWVPKTQLGFWGLVQRVFIALGGSNAAGADRYHRLRTDARSSAIMDMIAATDLVDPDDKDGAFLSAVAFLTSTNASSDSQVLMTVPEITAIMQKSNWAK